MKRRFIVVHPVTEQFVQIFEGDQGFWEAGSMTQLEADEINRENGNTERDLQVATLASMFGWEIPAAKQLSSEEKCDGHV